MSCNTVLKVTRTFFKLPCTGTNIFCPLYLHKYRCVCTSLLGFDVAYTGSERSHLNSLCSIMCGSGYFFIKDRQTPSPPKKKGIDIVLWVPPSTFQTILSKKNPHLESKILVKNRFFFFDFLSSAKLLEQTILEQTPVPPHSRYTKTWPTSFLYLYSQLDVFLPTGRWTPQTPHLI